MLSAAQEHREVVRQEEYVVSVLIYYCCRSQKLILFPGLSHFVAPLRMLCEPNASL